MPRISLRKLTTKRRLRPGAWWRQARTSLYTLAGFTCITTAAWLTIPQLGWLTAGLALLALEALGNRDDGSSG